MITEYGFFLDILVCFLISLKLIYNLFTKGKSNFTMYFLMFFLSFTVFFIFFVAPFFLYHGNIPAFNQDMNLYYAIAHIFLYIGFSFLVVLVVDTFNILKKYEWIIFILGLIFGTIISIVNFTHQGNAHLDLLQGIVVFNPPQIIGILIGIFSILSLGLSGFIFFRYGLKLSGIARKRSLIIALGILLLMIAGPMNDNVSTPSLALVAFVLSSIANITLGIGAGYFT